MSKRPECNPDQLQLRVFSPLDGGRTLVRSDAHRSEERDLLDAGAAQTSVASVEDRAIYDAIVERYFNSDR